MKVDLALMKKVFQPLAKSVLIPLELTAAESGTDTAIQKELYGSWTTILIIWNKEEKDTEMMKYLEESGFLIKSVIKKIKNEVKKTYC